jgi:hypothetical protein
MQVFWVLMLSNSVNDYRHFDVSKGSTAFMSKGQGVLDLAFFYPNSLISRTHWPLKRNKLFSTEISGVKPLLIIATIQKTRCWLSTLWRPQDSFSKAHFHDSLYFTTFVDMERLQHTLTRDTVNTTNTPTSLSLSLAPALRFKPFII